MIELTLPNSWHWATNSSYLSIEIVLLRFLAALLERRVGVLVFERLCIEEFNSLRELCFERVDSSILVKLLRLLTLREFKTYLCDISEVIIENFYFDFQIISINRKNKTSKPLTLCHKFIINLSFSHTPIWILSLLKCSKVPFPSLSPFLKDPL